MNDVNHLQRIQSYWDWRAAGNFICGGAGAALVACTALHAMDSPAAPWLLAAGLGLVGLGLFFVWLEIGRPWRAINVFLHLRSSWMSREAVAACLLFLLGAGLIFGMTWRAWPVALVALFFIYCQARIVMAARGIPAWREKATGVLLFVTALAEGAGLFCAVMAWVGLPARAAIGLGVLLIVRAVGFQAWRRRMEAGPATAAAQWAQHCAPRIRVAGAFVPLLALVLAIFAGALAPVLVTVAGLLAAATGAAFKFLLITRMGQHQGYSLPHMPVRGVPRVAPR